jgi:hypothetical protein
MELSATALSAAFPVSSVRTSEVLSPKETLPVAVKLSPVPKATAPPESIVQLPAVLVMSPPFTAMSPSVLTLPLLSTSQ